MVLDLSQGFEKEFEERGLNKETTPQYQPPLLRRPLLPKAAGKSYGIYIDCKVIIWQAMRPGCLPSLTGCELWAPVLKVVCNGSIMGAQGFRIRCPYYGRLGSSLDLIWKPYICMIQEDHTSKPT